MLARRLLLQQMNGISCSSAESAQLATATYAPRQAHAASKYDLIQWKPATDVPSVLG